LLLRVVQGAPEELPGRQGAPTIRDVRQLLEETKMTLAPSADVAENLLPKSDEEDEEACLERLIEALGNAKEEARKKSEEEKAAAAEATAARAMVKKEGQKTSNAGKQENGGRGCAQEVKENGIYRPNW